MSWQSTRQGALAAIETAAAPRASPAPATKATDRANGVGHAAEPHTQLGTIKFFKPEKGFGFILPDDGGKDVFLSKDTARAAGLQDLAEGDPLEFEPGPDSEGPEAKVVRRAP